jgi:hypothetical protein
MIFSDLWVIVSYGKGGFLQEIITTTPAYKFVPTFNRDKNSLLLSFRRKEKSLSHADLKHMVERFLLTSK